MNEIGETTSVWRLARWLDTNPETCDAHRGSISRDEIKGAFALLANNPEHLENAGHSALDLARLAKLVQAQATKSLEIPAPEASKSQPVDARFAPSTLEISAEFGTYVLPKAPPPPDPLSVTLKHVMRNMTIQVLNFSTNPEASWDCADDIITLAQTNADQGPTYMLKLSDNEAIKRGIRPGDSLAFRQVSRVSGQASEPTYIKLRQERRMGVIAVDGKPVPQFVPATDDYKPVVITRRLTICAADGHTLNVRGDRALAPGYVLTVRNMSSGKSYRGTVNNSGLVEISLPGKVGDQLRLEANDRRNAVHIGTLTVEN